MKAFISADKNIYYESVDKINPLDLEVPVRPSIDHIYVNGNWMDKNSVNQHTSINDIVHIIQALNHQDPKNENPTKDKTSFLGDKFTWKDLITILYFAGGIIGLWMHMNERIIILEQKVVSIEKGSAELQATFKEFTVENKNQLKNIDSKISDLQQMVISRISSRDGRN